MNSHTREPWTPRNQHVVIAASDQMKSLLEYAAHVATSDAKVLITGETGVGKDVLARHIHAHSQRRGRPYVAVNCAGVTESLLESELFGHVKGSFTGAYRDKPGTLQVAHGGTLFLDEVGEMSPRMQGLLLRFLESGEIQAVGADVKSGVVNVRVIAATNRNLSDQVAKGEFRADLLYRLQVIHLHVPPLRERREDIKALAVHLLSRLSTPITLTSDAWDAMEQYPWPGNVRELQNVVEQIAARTRSPELPVDASQLPSAIHGSKAAKGSNRDRRMDLADELYNAMVHRGATFFEHVHPLFMRRDITRHDLRELVRKGLSVTRGQYRGLLALFHIPWKEYKRFMSFLTEHDCKADFREFRRTPGVFERRARPGLLIGTPHSASGFTAPSATEPTSPRMESAG